MENSFFEYRDKTGVESESDSEVIDESIIDNSFSTKKTPGKKNRTVFVAESAESEESLTEDESEDDEMPLSKIAAKRIHLTEPHIISSSDDDGSRSGSIRQHSKTEQKVLLSSSDEEEVSPELVPRKRPPLRPSSGSNTSFIGRKTKKRIVLIDSDTEDSIIIEHKKHNKLTCLKDTPLKIDDDKTKQRKVNLEDTCCDDTVMTGDDSKLDESKVYDTDGNDEANDINRSNDNRSDDNKSDDNRSDDNKSDDNRSDDNDINNDSCDDDDDEDQMLMSRATRMSIMGVVPQNDDSDDSDFIQSDESTQKSRGCSLGGSLTDLPEVTLSGTPLKESTKAFLGGSTTDLPNISLQRTPLNVSKSTEDIEGGIFTDLPNVSIPGTPSRARNNENNSSKITCSPFSSPETNLTEANPRRQTKQRSIDSPLQDVTNNVDLTGDFRLEIEKKRSTITSLHNVSGSIDLTMGYEPKESNADSPILISKGKKIVRSNTSERVIDDDITIIDSKPEIIALSSDDEDDVKSEKKSPRPGKFQETKAKSKVNTIKQYMVPESYPNQVVYVKEAVRNNELNKLERLKQDLQNIRQLLQEVDTDSLPDGGRMLVERLASMEAQVRKQGDKVASMVVEPENPTAEMIAKDGFGPQGRDGLSWEQLQMAANATQPRYLGKQGVATHLAERSLILDRLRDLHASLASCPAETQLAPAPAAMRSALMLHQRHALAWLQWRETQRPPAGILADDMGLGKTITMIALVASDKETNIDHDDYDDDDKATKKLAKGGTLVVCPASLMQQWGGEVSKHCQPHRVSVCLHHGAQRATQPHRLATYDMVVTTYNILQRDKEKNGVLMRIKWRRVILDEAHIIRNHKSATSAAVCALAAARRCCLTGTPVQNKDLDLFALLKFLRVAPFDQLPMWKKWVDDKSLGGQERLSTIMRCILLRRTKAQLQQRGQLSCLPARAAHVISVTLTKDEMNVYQKVLVFSKTLFAQFLHQRAEKHADTHGFAARPDKDSAYYEMHKKMIALQGAKPVKSHEILVLLLRLRQVCCHCGLIAAMLDDAGAGDADPAGQDLLAELNQLTLEDGKRKSGGSSEKPDDIEEEGTTVAEAIRSVLSPNNPVFDLKRQSSKIVAVMDCLNNNVFSNEGHKAVVVSQWTSVLNLVEQELKSRGVGCVTLSGNVPVPARPQLVNKLNDPNSDVKVMLLSLCAGGVGLNLCGANHLLLLDPHWNPQLEEQAQDRIYRVGQPRPVHIYRFMCLDTVEQSIRKLQEAKLQLAENVLTGARNSNASKLTIEDLRTLFNMG